MNPDVRSLLTEAQISVLRQNYNRALMNVVATKLVAAPYPPIAGLVAYAAERFYNDAPPVLTPVDRERCLIAIFVAGRRPAFALAVHVYWGLMEGMTVEETAEIIALSALYGGIDIGTDGMRTLSDTLKQLAAASDAGGDAAQSQVLLPALVAAFRK
ncbi:MAG: carboxymuconolactone decarboxylase family protein [Myxococcales bacterium]|nr:carboxymuconolactone decarboxylase family protein [Myxococcales bacterium]